MSFITESNEIARQLKQKRVKKNKAVGAVVSIDVPNGRKLLTTAEAAKLLNREPQTLRVWACFKSGPIDPVRINGRLAWDPVAIENLLNGVSK